MIALPLALFLAAASTAPAQPPSSSPTTGGVPSPVQVLDPADVTPHQTGYCVTEWDGGERVEMPLEVVGVMQQTAPERTAVLVRILDERLAGGGVVAGMSGSPVYIGGKLLGAVAFGWNFARDPLAGVTPFTAMETITPGQGQVRPPPPTLVEMAALAAGSLDPRSVLPSLDRPQGMPLLPLAVTGLPLAQGFGADALQRVGLQQVQSGGRDDASGVPQPGEMVAALLAWGDAILAAGGTVTAREGDALYTFGHPLFALGDVSFPAARARTLAVQQSLASPFKIFTVGQTFGAFVADRQPGMLARAGVEAKGLPIRVRVREGSRDHVWSFEVARVPLLEPLLTTYLTNASITAFGASTGDATVTMSLDAELADGRSLQVEQTIAGQDAVARAAAFSGALVDFIDNSGFPHPPLASLRVDIVREEAQLAADVTEAVPQQRWVRPGDDLTVEVRLQPYQAPPAIRRLKVHIPDTQPPGRLDLIVADGAAFSQYALKAEGVEPTDFAQQAAWVARLEPSTSLVLALESFDDGLARPGVSQPALPPSWAATLATGLGRQDLKRLKTVIVGTSRWRAPYPLSGAFRIPLTVKESLETR